MDRYISEEMLNEYEVYLSEQEKSDATINKYLCDLRKLIGFVNERKMTKLLVIS